ncbi:response regulator transcription factor [Nocardiopsis alba]|uniref:response regulator transcription factor n=1 Tax=Nocardiopsis alba TaxID=53437 RepID=UPI0033BACCF1
MRVLVVEDEPYMAEALQAGLRQEAIAADIALDGDLALERVAVNDYDAVVLDRDIPGTHGDEVCAVLVRDHPGTRIIMLTAAGRLRDKVDGFSLGADDYLTKPFALEELVMRLRALARRPATAVDPVLHCGDLRLDPYRREAHRGGRPLRLPRKQFAVLELLMRADGAVVTAETLLEKVWDEHADPFTTAPRVAVSHLRRVLGDPDPIVTVPGVGYRLVDPERER